MSRIPSSWIILLILSLVAGLGFSGCTSGSAPGVLPGSETPPGETDIEVLSLPDLTPLDLGGRRLKVVATTSIIGDVVAEVGGDLIDLTVLIEPGQDPHSFQPVARELTAAADADVIFVNGWDLEELLVHSLEEISEGVPIIPISANIQPLIFGGEEHDEDEGEVAEEGENHTGADPHVWSSIRNVEQWVQNTAQVFSDLDTSNSDIYRQNAERYLAELDALDNYAETQLAGVPAENRFLVTNHPTFSYFARDYGFTILGTVIPGISTLSEPSAGDLARLIDLMKEHGVCSLFTETVVNDSLARTVAAELDSCGEVRIIRLHTDSLGPRGSGTDSYLTMFRANIDAILEGLK